MGVKLKIVGAWRYGLRSVSLLVVAWLWLLLVPMHSQAQESRTIAGRRYTVHVVEAGQTLFAIGRSHAVPVEALLAANPEAKEGLSIGQEVLIPQDAVVRREVRTAPVMLRDGELLHTVAKKETLFGVARNYGLHINDLLERNPELNASGLREGMEVIIPMAQRTDVRDPTLRPAEGGIVHEHLVRPGETLYGLGQRYGVEPDRIAAANNGLPEGLKAGSIVRIPLPAGTEIPMATDPRPVMGGTMHRVGLMLPFALDRNDSLRAARLAPGDKPLHEATRIAAQFYAGALLAIEAAERDGLLAEVTVLDMGEDARTWASVLKRSELQRQDLFIGPFHRGAIEQLAKAHPGAHIVCPVPQSNKVILGHPNVSKATASRNDLIRHTARYVAQRHGRDNIILLKPDIHADRDAQDQMSRALTDALANQNSRLRDTALVARPGRRELGDLPGKLSHDRLNVVVAPSDDVEFVTNLVGKLKSLAAKQRIVLVGLESWTTMETVAATDLEVLGFMYASPTWVDHGDPRVQDFTRTFRERFGHDVDEYAFLGYDVTRHYLRAMAATDGGAPVRMDLPQNDLLHMGFRLTRTGPENGWRNEYAVMLQQKEYRLVKAP